MTQRRKRPIGQTIGGVLFGFEQQVFRDQPPPHELVHHAQPDLPVAAGDGTRVTIELPDDARQPSSMGDDRVLTSNPDHSTRISMTTTLNDPPATLTSRPAPSGLPDPCIQPPVIAESGDPFAVLRVIDLVARLERGRPVRIDEVVDRLNAAWVDWLFTRRVVVDALVALQANWMADYRNLSGIALEEGPSGSTVTIEDSSRVDPWIVNQAQRAAAVCRAALDEFARRDHVASGG